MEDRLPLQTLANGFTDNDPFPFPSLFARWYVPPSSPQTLQC